MTCTAAALATLFLADLLLPGSAPPPAGVQPGPGRLLLVAGGGTGGDGSPAVQARLSSPFGIDADRAGNLYLVELTGGRVLRIDPRGLLHVLAGAGEMGDAGDGTPAARATFNGLHGLAVGPAGEIYLADTWNHRVRKLDPGTGTIAPFAGTGAKGDDDAGPAAKARLGGIYSVALDPHGRRLILTDLDNRKVRAVDLRTGELSTLAGNGQRGVPADGADARSSPLVDPRAAVADSRGNVYILERGGHALRVVDAAGKVRTVAGAGQPGLSGDGGPAVQARLNGPKHLCLDRDGSVLIADTENHVIRRYRPADGTMARVAGTGKKGAAGVGGPPVQGELNQPHGVWVHPSGELYIADSSNHRVLKITR